MKKLICPLLVLLILAACKKESTIGTGSIVQNQSPITNSGSSALMSPFSAVDSSVVFSLMSSNSLSLSGFVFYAYQSYYALDQNNQTGLFQIATAKQVRNGLPVFFEDITFGFENGKLNGPPPASQFLVGNITLNTTPSLSLQTLRDTFIKIDNAQERTPISIKDSTLVAQLGYYNLNVNDLLDKAPVYIKAWYVHPLHIPWPQGYFRDDTGSPISFTPLDYKGPRHP